MGEAAKTVDDAIGQLFDYLQTTGKFNSTNVIIVADHGMTLLSSSRVVFIDDCVDLAKIKIVGMWGGRWEEDEIKGVTFILFFYIVFSFLVLFFFKTLS